MKTPVSAQAKTPVSAQAKTLLLAQAQSSHRVSPAGIVASLSIAGIVGSLIAGCAYNKETSSAITPMEIKPVGLVTKSAETPDAYYALGKYHFWQNRAEQARDAFEQALRLRPDSVEIMNGLAATYDRLGNYAEAQRLYREALAKAPQAAHIWSNYGYSLLLEGHAVEAAALFEKALDIDPADAVARRNLASAHGIAPTAQTLPAQAPAAAPASNAIVQIVPATQQQASGIISIAQATEKAPSSVVQDIVATSSMPEAQTVQPDSMNKVAWASTGSVASLAQAQPAAATPPSTAAWPAAASEAAVPPGFGHVRIEISNGNGVTGMARAMRTVMRPHGANVTRVTNALPFNTARTTIFCPAGLKDTASAIARFLPATPTVVIASVARRNVDIRVVLGADAAYAWHKNNTTILALSH